MRISDWSSDVCSSDLVPATRRAQCGSGSARRRLRARVRRPACPRPSGARAGRASAPHGRRRDRKSVVEGKSVSARVDLGGRRHIKKNQTFRNQSTKITKEEKTRSTYIQILYK